MPNPIQKEGPVMLLPLRAAPRKDKPPMTIQIQPNLFFMPRCILPYVKLRISEDNAKKNQKFLLLSSESDDFLTTLIHLFVKAFVDLNHPVGQFFQGLVN